MPPSIFRYFWFGGALLILAYIVLLRARMAVLVERNVATAGEVDRFLDWLVAWFVLGPVILGIVGLVAGWPSPFCGGILRFDTRARAVAALVNIAVWATVLWRVWRGEGAGIVGRLGDCLASHAAISGVWLFGA